MRLDFVFTFGLDIKYATAEDHCFFTYHCIYIRNITYYDAELYFIIVLFYYCVLLYYYHGKIYTSKYLMYRLK